MTSKPTPAETIERMRDGEDFRIEREDVLLMVGGSPPGGSHPAVRVWLQKPNGRWEKTGLLLMGPREKYEEDPASITIADVLGSLVAALEREVIVDIGSGEMRS